jgi:hypothetical protein
VWCVALRVSTATKGTESTVKILDRNEAIAIARGDKDEPLSVVRVHNPTFSLNLPRNLHSRVGGTISSRRTLSRSFSLSLSLSLRHQCWRTRACV